MGTMVDVPFGPPVSEVELPRAPLAFVVGQVRFERIASISSEEYIADFQEAIRGVYPVMRREQQTTVLIGPDGRVVPAEGSSVWRFDERPGGWQVTLAPDFVSLSTTRYTRRRDFLDRLRTITAAVQEHLRVRFCERLGVRYLDRVADADLLGQLAHLLKPEVLGVVGAVMGEAGVEQIHAFSDATYRLPEGAELHARWGLLPPQATLDPAIEPTGTASWILDIDAYSQQQAPFDATGLSARAEDLCERVYRFFRWAVQDAFLEAHGGRP
jgi:uncharacterized protein (TIGR04255 family)